MTVILICVIAHLLMGYGILIVADKVFNDLIETDTIIICLFWSVLLPIVILKSRIKNSKK